jgi:hypothetical protein
LIEDTEADALKELEKALLDSGYSLKVKDAILGWYVRN